MSDIGQTGFGLRITEVTIPRCEFWLKRIYVANNEEQYIGVYGINECDKREFLYIIPMQSMVILEALMHALYMQSEEHLRDTHQMD